MPTVLIPESGFFAINTYGELKTWTASYLHRTDLASSMDMFCALAEAQIRRDVERTRDREVTVTGVLEGETLAHPARYMEVRRLKVADKTLRYRSPEQYNDLAQRSMSGSYFTSIGQSLYVLGSTAGSDYELVYLESYTGFTDDADSNWLLQNAPDVYLWAMCRAAAVWADDDRQITKFDQLYGAAVGQLNTTERQQRHSGPLEIRPDRSE